MHPSERLARLGSWIKFDKLTVVDFDKNFCRLSIAGKRKRLLKAEAVKEVSRAVKVAYA